MIGSVSLFSKNLRRMLNPPIKKNVQFNIQKSDEFFFQLNQTKLMASGLLALNCKHWCI